MIRKNITRLYSYFSLQERILWALSILLILTSFFVFGSGSVLSLIASLIGATALIFCAKGNPIGQLLMVAFSMLYAVISLSYAYYGEVFTYMGMSLPMATVAFVSWMRHPHKGNKAEVSINRLRGRELLVILVLAAIVTCVFYNILAYFKTTNLAVSTFSVATSFFAACLIFRRSPYFALAYALNDVVLIVLWVLASIEDISYLSVVICFITFLANDLYSFFNWRRMERRQRRELA